jgi:PST family polysaccharide transporter
MNQPSQPKRSTAALVAIGAAWFMAMRWGLRLIGLASTVVLARLLVPADFGLVAIATSYLGLLDAISDLGVRTALIRHGAADKHFSETVFTMQVLRGIALALIVAASSFVLPGLMHDERLGPVIWLLALTPILGGLQNPRLALYERDLDFRRESAMQLTAKLASTIAAIAVAVAFRSYWALVAGLMIQPFMKVVLSYALSPWRPKFSLKSWRELFRFSGWLTGSYTLDNVSYGFDNMIVGGFLGSRATGLYNVGEQLANMPLGEFLPVVNRALFPGLLRFKDHRENLRRNALDVVGLLAGLSLPAAVGFAFVAPEAVHILYGAQWTEAVPLVEAISLGAGIATIASAVTTSTGLALGSTGLLFARSLVFACVRVPAFVIGTWLYGLEGAIAGYLAGSVVLALANIAVLCRMLRTGPMEIVRRLWRSCVAVGAMAAALYGLEAATGAAGPGLGATALLLAKMAVGAASYALARLALWKLAGKPESLEIRTLELFTTLKTRIEARSRSGA